MHVKGLPPPEYQLSGEDAAIPKEGWENSSDPNAKSGGFFGMFGGGSKKKEKERSRSGSPRHKVVEENKEEEKVESRGDQPPSFS